MVATKEQAFADLGANLERLEACVRGALGEYVSDFAETRHKLSRRSESSVIHDLMVRHCEAAFGLAKDNGGTVGVFRRRNKRIVLLNDGQYQIRLKKLDGQRRTRNIPTQAVLAFVRQDGSHEDQLAFEQVPPPTNLHAGYQIVKDPSLTACKIWIVCPNGNELLWEGELTALAVHPTESGATIERAQAVPRARIKPEAAAKRSKAKKSDRGGEKDGRR